MKKSSLIRQFLESYGFQQIGQKNCFISYTDRFCFEISFLKVGYSSRWEISTTINMLNAKKYELGTCPSDFPINLSSFDITLREWNVDKERYPDKHSESMIFIIEKYIIVYLTKIAYYSTPEDFETSMFITKNEESYQVDKKFIFQSKLDISLYSDINLLLQKDEFNSIFVFLEQHSFKTIKNEIVREQYERTFFNGYLYIILIIEKGLFLSFEVFNEDDYAMRDIMPRLEKTIAYFVPSSLQFTFGWLIASDYNCSLNISEALKKLRESVEI